MSAANINVCKITATRPKTVTKEFWLDGSDIKKKTTAHVTTGQMEIVPLGGITGFAELLQGLGTNQCLIYGTPPRNAKLVTEEVWLKKGKPADLLPRSKSVFTWPNGGGILMLDYDAPKDGGDAMRKEQLLGAVRGACPDFDMTDSIWWPSTSSCIYEGDTERVGVKGQRIYTHVADAKDIERAGKALNTRLWARGFGRYEVSSSGSLLERGMFDSSVWQTNRIDFAAGASCGDGLEQRRGSPELLLGFVGGAMDTTTAIPDPTPEEIAAANEAKRIARDLKKEDCEAQRGEWLKERVGEIIVRDGVTEEQAKQIATRAVEKHDLMGDWSIVCKAEGGEEITAKVLEVLDHPERFHGMLTLDPLEPDYDGRRWVGKLYLYSARPTLHSMAHGGVGFRLTRQPMRIEVVSGKGSETTDALLEVLRRAPDVFDFGAELVTIGRGGTIHPQNEHGLRYTSGGLTQFWRWQKLPQGGAVEMLLDPPTAIVKNAISLGQQRDLKPLDAVITAPTLRPDGSVLSTPGYDSSTRLLFEAAQLPPDIPEYPTPEQAKAALEYLWRPFSDFPFCGALDRAVHLAALLTAAVRAVLPTAPAFGYDAPVQGSGKTLLARCVGILAAGEDPGVWPHTAGRDDEEIRKRIFTVLRSGARALIWDNVVGSFDSAAMASAITSPTYQDRILGASNSSTVPNRMLLILTGNNLSLEGEMPRRVLVARIDPETDRPFAREFDLDPFAVCRAERQTMLAAALVLIRAYLTNCEGPMATGKLASFEQWDAWVRQTVLYAEKLMPGQFGDVMDVVKANQACDPEQELLGMLLVAWRRNFGNEFKSAHEVMAVINSHFHDLTKPDAEGAADALKSALGDMSRGVVTVRGIGKMLGYRAGRIVDGLRLVKKIDRTKLALWAVENVF
jgi:hypothetical protein